MIQNKKAYIPCNGCPENILDSSRLKEYLEKNGWQIIPEPELADVIFFNACGLTKGNETNSLRTIAYLKSKKSNSSRLIIWGCLPKINPQVLQNEHDGNFFGEQEFFSNIDQIIRPEYPIDCVVSNAAYGVLETNCVSWFLKKRRDLYEILFRDYLANERRINLWRPEDKSIFYMKISTGCLGHCTYCAVRNSRGSIKSKPIDAILAEFKSGLSHGYKEFSLMGTDLGGQGLDLNYNLCDLLREMIKEKGEYKIGIRNINPYFAMNMITDLEPILRSKKIWFIGMPVESGSNRLLELMGRQYSVEEYIECIRRIKVAYPGISFRNQILVGFPSETEKDFKESMQLIDRVPVDHHEIYAYSPRPNTAAEKWPGQLPAHIVKLRQYRFLLKFLRVKVAEN